MCYKASLHTTVVHKLAFRNVGITTRSRFLALSFPQSWCKVAECAPSELLLCQAIFGMRSSPVASCSGRQPAAASPLGRRRLQARPFHDVACCSTSSEASEAPVATGRLSARERLEALKRAQQDSDAVSSRAHAFMALQ